MKILATIDRIAVGISVTALVAMMLLISVSVIGRYFFAAPIPDDLVMTEFLMVVVVFLPFGAVQAAREHVFVTIFSEWLSNQKKVVLETMGVILGFFIFSIVAWGGYVNFAEAWDVGAYVEGPLELPESPVKFIAFLGLLLFCVRLLVDAIVSTHGIVTGTAEATRSEEARALDTEL